MKRDTAVHALLACALAIASLAARAASPVPVAAEHGMVVTAQHLATHVGVDVLKDGGNAIDAAVAVGYALAVVYPAAGNLGGGGFMTLQLANGRKSFLDFREKAPLAASADMYLDAAGNVIPGASTRGQLAVGVPGTVAGLELARTKYGTMTRAALIAPAIALARDGYVLSRADADILDGKRFAKDPVAVKIFLRPDGTRFEPGDRIV
ncbi:MAG: gamma-glutamyltransferase, partial [Burkholderiales bacterium]|nr:gamma-glutamyltransferase [Burkholderiales bacterium]